ncbi:MAG TPA: sensor histidine kinase, partial [Gammaproteobacteria bacterium]|nr:sensor histidine kinase [Gammaproteobacteria bacterium]
QLWHDDGPANQALLVWSGGYIKQDRHITIAVAEDLSPLQRQLRYYSALFAGITLLFLGVLLIVQRYIVRRSFQSLNAIKNELRQLEQGTVRQLISQAPIEVQPLVTEVNRLITLMDQRLQRSRNALGNLAHALKGPLNLITQICDNETLKQYPDIRNELLQHTKVLQQLIDHELKRARLAGTGGSGQYFQPQDELPSLEKLLQRLYEHKSLQIHHEYPDHALGDTDRNDMLELLGNLLDNACKWANTKVVYSIQQDQHITITVEDDGPGCSDEQLKILTQRGVKLDESVPGHGLGLAIVKDIVNLYNGEMQFDRSPELGGLRVIIKLRF